MDHGNGPRLTRRGALAAGLMLAAGGARAQATYPDRPIRLVVPFLAGGGGDTLSRLATGPAQARLGQTLVVENRPGAGGNVGAEVAARAAPDGYTLFYGTNGTHAINEALYPRLNFRPHEDFTPVAPLSRIVLVVLVKRELPVETLPALIAWLKANPGKASYGSAGNGTTGHIAAEMFRMAAGVDILHVPYRGNAAAMTDLAAGRIDMAIELIPAAFAAMQNAAVRTLAVTSATPLATHPNLPTVASVLPGFQVSAWDGIFAPAGTPEPMIARLNAAFSEGLRQESVVAALRARGAEPAPMMSPAEFAAFIATERVRWGAAVRASGAQLG
ncbi:Bug family tripartite tricarboxylate transporter substrate binding protein [Falsiroseomonas selenitidurans]|uniref:Tripartite tricarboxylate transporter substrate binding protein n=1 Tax=Falsiroseomonas selenitidurans TaxID=2716335 RepID=A0ABX1DWN5_9PROT|nr:tripartite tricarboxylate transporter substrate binding protein [Falsiroseomonas selenitidurans]NKC29315.1 tripartite tricarboxylate transporter substrate binding protein [Falsiroseomonas selenitidurans]